jgi:16S rRNA (cytidine1402-2'-O)-methyltransferase
MLYLVPTPIGNLSDITFRAIETLKACDYILCEDTRHTAILLKHYEIQKPLKSYHKFNLASQEESIIYDLKQGLNIALVSDAGTPGIADPSYELIVRCQKENLPYTSLPGACAAIVALTMSGFSSDKFQFLGFAPKTSSELKNFLIDALQYTSTSIFYETPHRLVKTLQMVYSLAKDRKLCILREISKIYEESLQGTAETLLEHFTKHEPRGEIVLLISGQDKKSHTDLSPKEHVLQLQNEYSLSLQEAIKMAASLRDEPKRSIYKLFHADEKADTLTED